jgi:predicted ArsR family transcriptional regulator
MNSNAISVRPSGNAAPEEPKLSQGTREVLHAAYLYDQQMNAQQKTKAFHGFLLAYIVKPDAHAARRFIDSGQIYKHLAKLVQLGYLDDLGTSSVAHSGRGPTRHLFQLTDTGRDRADNIPSEVKAEREEEELVEILRTQQQQAFNNGGS